MIRIMREPLLHFLLIGAGLFLLFGWRGDPVSPSGGQCGPQSTTIVVSRGDLEQMLATFSRTWQRPPTQADLSTLIDSFVRDEIYYREALAMGLDRDDAVIRRRMRQKIEFIYEDLTTLVEPTDDDLRAFMERHPEPYHVDPRISFGQVYVDVSKRGDKAVSDAREILAQLNSGVDPNTLGDPLLVELEARPVPLRDISKLFGEDFSRALADATPGRWEGPIPSQFGLHLVVISEFVGGRLPELEEIRDAVKRDWAAERQKQLKDAAYTTLRARYTVQVEQLEPDGSLATAHAGNQGVLR